MIYRQAATLKGVLEGFGTRYLQIYFIVSWISLYWVATARWVSEL